MVRTERETQTPGRRRPSRAWSLLAAAFIALPLLLLLIPAASPINVQLGPARLFAGTTMRHRTMSSTEPRQGFSAFNRVTNRIYDLENRPYRTTGRVYGGSLRIADWVYYLAWFQGGPVP